ncbi:hypothetical protein EHW66_19165 [Erwinia psidii]|uniref:hypothetical protein n=1 Tax=Erwinia psidii TaxID=69224 RepID=UPI00226B8F11|nr:hypothetical protein [Erwinia psidii]MCX8967018.1 hypothetical protein [Erwinia psidii]
MNFQKNHDKDGWAWLSKTNSFLDALTKLIQVIIFLLLASGSFQLLLFTKHHGVRFVDLLQSNFIISFSSLFIVWCVFPVIFLSLVFPVNVNFRESYINFFSNAKVKYLSKDVALKMFLFFILVSLWPIFIKCSIIGMIAYPVVILVVFYLKKISKSA